MPSAHLPRPAAAGLAVAALVGGAAVLGGCDSEATPPASTSATRTTAGPSGSPSPSESPSRSASPSVEIPAAAREKSDKGAEAFVRYFFDQVNRAWTEPTPGLIPMHSDRGCKSCASLEETAAKLRTQRQRYDSKPIAVRSVTAVKGAPSGQTYVEARLLQKQAHVIDSKGAIVSTDKKSPFDRTVSVIWQGDRWLVYAIA